MKPATGFFMLVLIHAAASSSALPPISPIITTASVPGSSLNNFKHIDEVESMHRIAADADAGRLPQPQTGQLIHGLVGQRAAARHDADGPRAVDVAGHDADLALARGDRSGAIGAEAVASFRPAR